MLSPIVTVVQKEGIITKKKLLIKIKSLIKKQNVKILQFSLLMGSKILSSHSTPPPPWCTGGGACGGGRCTELGAVRPKF